MGFIENINRVAQSCDNIDIIGLNIDNIMFVFNMCLGPKDTAPTTRNDGSDLQNGDVYLNTTENIIYIFSNSSWLPIRIYTNEDILSMLKEVDGQGSGLDADLLDGLDSYKFIRSDVDASKLGDLEFTDVVNGIILIDRDNNKKYRLFIQDGNLGIEEV